MNAEAPGLPLDRAMRLVQMTADTAIAKGKSSICDYLDEGLSAWTSDTLGPSAFICVPAVEPVADAAARLAGSYEARYLPREAVGLVELRIVAALLVLDESRSGKARRQLAESGGLSGSIVPASNHQHRRSPPRISQDGVTDAVMVRVE